MHADLHIHSHFSDGTYAPEDLPRLALQHGLGAVALTDHDTIDGCLRAAEACRKQGIEFLAGVELTAEHHHQEIHLLGYGIDLANKIFDASLALFQRTRQQRIRDMVERINALDIPLDAATVFQIANCQSPGRPHVGRALVLKGFCSGLEEAFERFLKRNRPAWVPKLKISAPAAIRLIHQAGGAAVMAHPGLIRAEPMLAELAAAGLDGLECFHTKHSPEQCEHFLRLAQDYSLIITGGSDCHGKNHQRPTIGAVKLPWENYEVLKQYLSRRSDTLRAMARIDSSVKPQTNLT
jgi:3',5'-nucleoside bisphosphate phosphatase